MSRHHDRTISNQFLDALGCELIGRRAGDGIDQAHRLIDAPETLFDSCAEIVWMRDQQEVGVDEPFDQSFRTANRCDKRRGIGDILRDEAIEHALVLNDP